MVRFFCLKCSTLAQTNVFIPYALGLTLNFIITMKKLFSVFTALLLIVSLNAGAQEATKAKKETVKKEQSVKTNSSSAGKVKKDGTPDKRYKENKKLKKDGTPDKRYKENKK